MTYNRKQHFKNFRIPSSIVGHTTLTFIISTLYLQALKYLRSSSDDAIHWELIRCAAESVARTMIVPLQDVMGLDNSARMNTPAVQVCTPPKINMSINVRFGVQYS